MWFPAKAVEVCPARESMAFSPRIEMIFHQTTIFFLLPTRSSSMPQKVSVRPSVDWWTRILLTQWPPPKPIQKRGEYMEGRRKVFLAINLGEWKLLAAKGWQNCNKGLLLPYYSLRPLGDHFSAGLVIRKEGSSTSVYAPHKKCQHPMHLTEKHKDNQTNILFDLVYAMVY